MENNNLGRFHEILKVLKENDLLRGVTPAKLCHTLEQLGPTFIKLGQILSTRVDLLPADYCESLSKLRNQVTPLDFDVVESILSQSYENYSEIFTHIEKIPIGSASIAQVHKAKLRFDNSEVVLKIKRPNIEKVFEEDFFLFKKAIDTLHLNRLFPVMNLQDVLDQLYQSMMEEANFVSEMNHLLEFRQNNFDSSYITCPYVYKNLCTKDILVMEYINGIKINDVTSLNQYDFDLENLADLLSENYMKQALDDGFFHADPHPDNIFVDSKIVYIDLGMMGRLSGKNKQLLKNCISSIVNSDYKEVARILVALSTPVEEVDYLSLEKDVQAILEEFESMDLENISIVSFISKMFYMLRDNHLILNHDVTLLVRGIGILESVLQTLNPKMSLLKVLMKREEKSFIDPVTIHRIKDSSRKIARNVHNMVELPNELNSFLKSLNNGETKFKVELSDSTKQVDKLENLVHELILGFIDGCLIIATVLVEQSFIKWFFIVLLIGVSVLLIIKMIQDIIHKGY